MWSTTDDDAAVSGAIRDTLSWYIPANVRMYGDREDEVFLFPWSAVRCIPCSQQPEKIPVQIRERVLPNLFYIPWVHLVQ